MLTVHLAMLALEAALAPLHVVHSFVQGGAWPICSAQIEKLARDIAESSDEFVEATDRQVWQLR